jgi:AbrB family looped-hinge helix DNA binding protein
VTTSVSAEGAVTIPPGLRKRKRIRPGDDFEVLEDEDDPSIIILRKKLSKANAGLVDHLLACPDKNWFKPTRKKHESLRKARL